jgi:hypothetical protein
MTPIGAFVLLIMVRIPGANTGSSSTGGSCSFTLDSDTHVTAELDFFRLTVIGESCASNVANGTYEVAGPVGSRAWPGGQLAPYPTMSCGGWSGPICCIFGSDPNTGQYCERQSGQARTTTIGISDPQRQALIELIDQLGTGTWFSIRDHRSIVCASQ